MLLEIHEEYPLGCKLSLIFKLNFGWVFLTKIVVLRLQTEENAKTSHTFMLQSGDQVNKRKEKPILKTSLLICASHIFSISLK